MLDRILIVDNEILINKFLEARFKKENLEVDVAYDGMQALNKIKKHKYDLILTDLILPYVAGVELIMQIKKSDKNADTPVIVLSSLTADEVIVDVLSIGAQDYITKPFSISVVMAKIKQILQVNETAA